MWIELLKPVGDTPAGKFIEVDEPIARGYISAGLAKDGGDGPDVVLLQRSLDTFRNELRTFVEGTAKAITDATAGALKAPIVRGLGVGDTITPTDSEADKRSGWGDIVRNMGNVADVSVDHETRMASLKTLNEVYGFKSTGNGMWALGEKPAAPHVARAFARSFPTLARAGTEGTGTTGGYLTTVTYETMVMQVAAESTVFANRAQNVPLGSRQVEWPVLNQYTSPASGQAAWFGGVKVYRKGEASQRTAADPAYNKIVLNANDLTAYDEFSRDLLQDSVVSLDAYIPQLMGGAIGWRTDWEIFNGTGSGQFLGINNSNALVTVSRGTASHISYADVFNMAVRMLPSDEPNAVWFTHPFAMADIYQLKDGSNRNVYLPVIPGTLAGPIASKASGTLLGYPVIKTEKLPTLGTQGDLCFFAMNRYLLGSRSGLEIGLSEHFKWDTDQIAIRAKVRNDGKPQLLNSIYLSDGSGTNKVSAFVTLAT